MGIFDPLEKLINEHGSAAILREQLSLAKSQYAALERQVGDAMSKITKLEAQNEIERLNHKETQLELDRLKDEYSEEVRLHKSIEFRRGKRTKGEWMAFCPACHTLADLSSGFVSCANPKCGWQPTLAAVQLDGILADLKAQP